MTGAFQVGRVCSVGVVLHAHARLLSWAQKSSIAKAPDELGVSRLESNAVATPTPKPSEP